MAVNIGSIKSSREVAWGSILGGFLLSGVGGLIAVTEIPGTTVGAFGTPETTGSVGGFWAGNVLAGIGATFLLIGIVALGVSLGMHGPLTLLGLENQLPKAWPTSPKPVKLPGTSGGHNGNGTPQGRSNGRVGATVPPGDLPDPTPEPIQS
jgi:hypothetical protein